MIASYLSLKVFVITELVELAFAWFWGHFTCLLFLLFNVHTSCTEIRKL